MNHTLQNKSNHAFDDSFTSNFKNNLFEQPSITHVQIHWEGSRFLWKLARLRPLTSFQTKDAEEAIIENLFQKWKIGKEHVTKLEEHRNEQWKRGSKLTTERLSTWSIDKHKKAQYCYSLLNNIHRIYNATIISQIPNLWIWSLIGHT
jgi:hypothetical protein